MLIEMGMGMRCALGMGGNWHDGKLEEIGTIRFRILSSNTPKLY